MPNKTAPTAQAPASLLNPTFKYVPANQTDVQRTWRAHGWKPIQQLTKPRRANIMLLDKQNRAILNGDVVLVKGKAFTVHHADPRSGYIQVLSCEDRPVFRTVFPRDIGARWAEPVRNSHVHPAMMEALSSCLRF